MSRDQPNARGPDGRFVAPELRGPDGRPVATPGRRWRARRDWVICLCATAGVSQRLLADVFDLPHSRIAAIVKAWRQNGGPRGPAHPEA